MKTEKVQCDGCGKDLSGSGPSPEYMIVMRSVSIPTTSSYRHAILVYPQLKEDHHFCSIKCVHDWAEGKK